ncbi:hypothetical protein EUZ85_26395 [Hahella sp. KA22]|uniref:hypothetical protein n=1 Tax=Hahella sp. KA22 TaxID=1628392 RepID=UPI000FDEFC35|nr:hypothetical protein [Hahella sp. KA22]AZZ94057.1 hypothetical protein ENC22_23810 [Hahella sp. KA22]QAY57431.1 hypothetical protein EUZ85_26395 [Hahella sp. KA22]
MSLLTLKLRKKRPCIPIGPDFSKAEAIQISLSGTKVSFLMNRHLPDGFYEEYISPSGEYNLFDSNLYETDRRKIGEEACYKELRYIVPLRRCWAFRGQAFTGYAAQVDATVSVQRITPSSKDFSLLRPDHFQQFITDALTTEYGHLVSNGRSKFDAPVNWKPDSRHPIHAVSFEVTPVTSGDDRKVIYAFPVDHEVCVFIYFHLLQYEPGELSKKDAMVSPKPLYELVESIISSVKIELSASALNELEQIKSTHSSAKISKTLSPLKWTTPEQDAEWEEYCKNLVELRRLSYSDQQVPKSEKDKLLNKMNAATTEEEMLKLMEQAAEMEAKHSSQGKKS